MKENERIGQLFFKACKEGNMKDVESILSKEDFDVNQADNYGCTPFYIACAMGHKEIVQFLMNDEKIDVNKDNKYGETPFYIACQNGHQEIVSLLLDNERIDVNKANEYSANTPFLIVCENGNKELAQLLVNNKRIDVNKTNKYKDSPFFRACQSKNKELVELLVNNERIEVNAYNTDYGRTAFFMVCENGNKELVELLVNNDRIDVNKGGEFGRTPFSAACDKKHKEIIPLLLKNRKIIIDEFANLLQTPFFSACQRGEKEIVSLLMNDEGIDVNKINSDGKTPFFIACENGHQEIVSLLLDNERIDVNKGNKNGKTPFYIACESGNKEAIFLLIKDKRIMEKASEDDLFKTFVTACREGNTEIAILLMNDKRIDVNKANSDGKTPFFIACENGHQEIVSLLMNNERIDVNKANSDGKTPFFIACESGHQEIVSLLMNDKRIDVNKANKRGETPFYIAVNNGHTEKDPKKKETYKEIVKTFINAKKEGQELINNFIEIFLDAENMGPARSRLEFNTTFIISCYDVVFKDETNTNHLDQLIKIAQGIHPDNEQSQVDILLEALKRNLITTENFNKETLKNYLKTIKNDKLVLDLIKNFQQKNLLNEKTTILDLVQGRTAEKFKFIKELLNVQNEDKKGKTKEGQVKQRPLQEFLTKEGFDIIKNLFGENYLKSNQISILDIISYFDSQNQLTFLVQILLEPEFKKHLKENIKGSENILLIKQEEIKKIAQLLGLREDEIKKRFTKNSVLCEYFEKKLPQIPDLTQIQKDNYKVDFTGSDFTGSDFTELRQHQINQEFRKLLKERDQNKKQQDFVKLFNLIVTGSSEPLDETIQSHQNQRRLKEFFKNSEKELLFVLRQRGGIGIFTSLKSTLVDGCSANIGTQFSAALTAIILKEPQDQILYQVLAQNIIPEILNTHGGNVIHDNSNLNSSNPLTNPTIKDYYLSPEVLFEKVCKVFIGKQEHGAKQKEQGEDSYQFIENFLVAKLEYSPKVATSIKQKLGENLGYDNIKAREVAAYLILKHTIGEKETLKVGSKAVEARDNLYNAAPELFSKEISGKKLNKSSKNDTFKSGSKTLEDIDLGKPEDKPSKSPEPNLEKTKKAKDDFEIGMK